MSVEAAMKSSETGSCHTQLDSPARRKVPREESFGDTFDETTTENKTMDNIIQTLDGESKPYGTIRQKRLAGKTTY